MKRTTREWVRKAESDFRLGNIVGRRSEPVRGPDGEGAASRYNAIMKRKSRTPARVEPPRWYRGADIPMRVIRRFAREVAERFQPDKIILFGSYGYGTPHEDSDVDILVVMPARNELDQALRIRLNVEYNFPLDLLVRTPKNLSWRLVEGDSFLQEVVTKGKVLYEKNDPRVGAKSRGRLSRRRKVGPQPPADA
jgi:predicted nucleotidyltransferase